LPASKAIPINRLEDDGFREGAQLILRAAILMSKLTKENAMQYERIEINPDIMYGKPVIRGTRVPVELVLRKLGAGMSSAAILAEYPRLTEEDIDAAQAFAIRTLS
jgi:uncharacterized protein (DUF433 family)